MAAAGMVRSVTGTVIIVSSMMNTFTAIMTSVTSYMS